MSPVLPRALLVVGTDTGVGKTFVGRSLAGVLRARGARVVAVKPVESGCSDLDDTDQDGVLLARATGQEEPRHALVRLGPPLAPPVAAEIEGVELDFDGWLRAIRAHSEADLVLVEGAGGLLSPLTRRHTALDLALALEAEVVVVTADRLGTLNHTLLTLEALRRAGIRPRAVVASAPASRDESTGRNAAEIARWGSVAVIELPRTTVARAADLLAPLADWIVG